MLACSDIQAVVVLGFLDKYFTKNFRLRRDVSFYYYRKELEGVDEKMNLRVPLLH